MAQYLELIAPITSTTTMVVFSIFEPPCTPGLRSQILRQRQRRVQRRFNQRHHRFRSPDPLWRNHQWRATDAQLTQQSFETGCIAPTRNEVHEMRGQSDIPVRHQDRSDHFGVRNSYFLVRKGGSIKEIQNQNIHGVSALAAFRSTPRMISALIIHMSNRFLHFLI